MIELYIQPTELSESWPFLLVNTIIVISFIILVLWLSKEKKITERKKDIYIFFLIVFSVITIDLYIFPLENINQFFYANFFYFVMGVVI
ncbi:unnamed protein product [marine sediment metagenome]|uniref:Uncharacterized protein n=1 Tax=marine sediment metagenome TaxID=412755 RepID=X0ZAH0_9ZZZZ